MGARYHPLYDGVWNDDAFDATSALPRAPFEEIAFFVFVCGNPRQRPSGIYRASDEQLAIDSRLSVTRVRAHLASLQARGRLVRDGAWLFILGYLGRQPKHEPLKRGVERDILECSSRAVLEAFGQRYPHFHQWSADRLATLTRQSVNGHPTVYIDSPDTEQSRAEQVTVARRSVMGQDDFGEPTDPDAHDAWLETPHGILALLNKRANRNYRASAVNLDLIRTRLKDGITPTQLRVIITRKVAEWQGDAKMAKFLRPATLFGKTNCEQYVGEIPRAE